MSNRYLAFQFFSLLAVPLGILIALLVLMLAGYA
jgi:hypothetical protein